VRQRFADNLNALSIEEVAQVQPLRVIRIRRQGAERSRRLIAIRRTHPVEDVFVRDNRGASPRVAYAARGIAAGDRGSCRRKFLVPAGVVRVDVSINDVANRLCRSIRTDKPGQV
jgi:hypothetical protein